MTKIHNQESQFELFHLNSSKPVDPRKTLFEFRNFTISLENTIVFGIVIIMATILFYSFGVEKGKRALQLAQSGAPKINADNSQENVIIDTSVALNQQNEGQAAVQSADKTKIIDIPKVEEISQESAYTIQVASFKLDKYAQKEALILKDLGFETTILKKGSHLIVCVGRFPQKNEAQQYTTKLKKRYKDFLVRRL